ncbi:uncharacterized protein LOC109819492 isoform X2 [Asparagus officinalis]|uniref:uncharacterized protein LOC109819492 isoform X2 n=1 Tax=Asparagus officinalis TaxID=4686 RepID=UPI00098E39D5|nr:uncharacterized protein LOC109819492 isoform X2 [Asparagus officinalis]
MDEDNRPMDLDLTDSNNCNAQSSNEKSLVATPVDGGSSGRGLPYAPQDWPKPGDVWTWKVGKRRCASGHWVDKSICPPRHLRNSSGNKLIFHSRSSLKQYILEEYPEEDVDAFFASFIWRVPATGHILKESGPGLSKIVELNGRPKSELASGLRECKAGNKMCSLRTKAKSYAIPLRSCDICCSEPGFCHECCCILCSKTVDWTYGGYSFIRCEAPVDERFICGHVAHIECALRAYLAGKVGGNVGLDAQYYCRCCDNKTDLLPHVDKFVKTCESLDSGDDVQRILSLGVCILRGSEQERAKDLQSRIALIMDKLKHGVSLNEIWREQNDISTPTAGSIPLLGKEVITSGTLDIATVDSMNWIEHYPETDDINGRAQGNLYITSDHSNASLKLEDAIDGVLQELKMSQKSEYRLAEQKLYAQKDFLLGLYQQLEVERSALANPTQMLTNGNVSDNLLSNVLNRVDQIKREEAKLEKMLMIAKGFGETPKTVLNAYFGLPVID